MFDKIRLPENMIPIGRMFLMYFSLCTLNGTGSSRVE